MSAENHPLVGKKVSVYWKEGQGDWMNYEVIYFSYPIIGLKGLQEGNTEYRGGPIWIHFDLIDMIEEGLSDGS